MFTGMLSTQWDVVVKQRHIKKSVCALVLAPFLTLALFGCASAPKKLKEEGFVMGIPQETTSQELIIQEPLPKDPTSKPLINPDAVYGDIMNVVWQLSEIRISYGKTELNRWAMEANGLADIYILQLTEEGISGKAAPNRYFTTFEIMHNRDYRLRPIVGTLIAANINIGGLMENEYYWYLQRTTHWEIINNGLELYAKPSPGEEIVMRYTRQ
jgi:hypothetical protein